MTIDDTQIRAWRDGEIELHTLLGIDDAAMDALRGRAQFFIDGHHDERALLVLEMLEHLDRTDLRPTLAAVDILLDDGRSDAAEARLESLLARASDDPEVRVAHARLLVQAARLTEAASILDTLLSDDPDAQTPAGQRAHALVAETLAKS